MVFLAFQLIHGAANGALYGLLGIALGLLMRGRVIPNPALGAVASLSALAAFWASDTVGLPFLVCLLFAMATGAVLGGLVELLTVAPLGRPGVLRQTSFAPVVVAIACWIGLDALAVWATGPDPVTFDPDFYPTSVFGDGANIVRLLDLFSLVLAVGAWLALRRTLNATPFGLSLRAVRFDALASAIGGVSPRRTLLFASLLGGALAGLAGTLAAVSANQFGIAISPALGDSLLWKAIASIVLLSGTAIATTRLSPGRILLGGILLGMLETSCALYIPQWMPITPWQGDLAAVLLLGLLLCPRGLFPARLPLGRSADAP